MSTIWVARVFNRVYFRESVYKTVCVEASDVREALARAEEFGEVISIQPDRRKEPRQ